MTTTPRFFARSYGVYYGKGPLPGLENLDLAILEPMGWQTSQLRELKAAGVKVLAYLSVLEVPPWRESVAGLQSNDLIQVHGSEPWVKQPFGNRLARPDSKRWRLFLEQHLTQLYRQGWDGLFLDTLGDVEDEELAPITGWLAPATADLIHLCRRLFSDRILIANNGLWGMVPLLLPYLDGVSWEGQLTPPIMREPWAQAMLDFLGQMRSQRGWVNLMLTQMPHDPGNQKTIQDFYLWAERLGFLAYAAPGDYTHGIRLRDGRIAIPASY